MKQASNQSNFICVLVLVGSCATLALGPRAAVACGGPGNPSCGTGSASQSSPNGTTAVGNPFNVVSGNKYLQYQDFALPGALSVEFTRHYNSLGGSSTAFGTGWSHGFETRLAREGKTDPDGQDSAVIRIDQGDGREIVFRARGKSSDGVRLYYAIPAGFGVIEEKTAEVDRALNMQTTPRSPRELSTDLTPWIWRWGDGRQIVFDVNGLIRTISDTDGERLTLQHDSRHRLSSASDRAGRTLHFEYWENSANSLQRFETEGVKSEALGSTRKLRALRLPDGGNVTYFYDAAGLLSLVRYPDGRELHYEYQSTKNGWRLTGIRNRARELMARYEYDERGYGSSTEGWEGTNKVQLEYHVARRANELHETWIKNSRGELTVYRWREGKDSQQWQLIEALGPGCATCAPSNVRYRYDRHGLIDQVEWLSEGTADQQRRVVVGRERIQRDDSARVTARYVAELDEGGQRRETLRERYTYRTNSPLERPAKIERPSVKDGSFVSVEYGYNDRGQVTSVSEVGYAPAEHTNQYEKIARLTRFEYHSTADEPKGSAGRLKAIDGPLPGDGDTLRVFWDPSGASIVRLVEPLGFRTELGYDSLGRLVTIADRDNVTTKIAYDSQNRPTQYARSAPGSFASVESIAYDEHGNVVEVGTGARGTRAYRPSQRNEFDNAGRLLWSADALGVLRTWRYGIDDEVVEESTQTSTVNRTLRYDRDATGRVIAIWKIGGPAGGGGATQAAKALRADLAAYFEYGLDGGLRLAVDALGRATEFGPSPTARPHARSTDVIRDDFGRVVARTNNNSGLTRWRFDAADNLVGATDALGNRAEYEYDAAGRIVRQVTTNRATGKSVETRWRYSGRRLIALESAQQSETYAYDSSGRTIARVVELRLHQDGTEPRSIKTATRYAYDADGRLETMSLADGSSVRYVRNGQGQVVGAIRVRVQTSWLKWLLPDEPLIVDLQRDLVGLKRISYGNGIVLEQERDSSGHLLRSVSYARSSAEQAEENPTRATSPSATLAVAGASAPAAKTRRTSSAAPAAVFDGPWRTADSLVRHYLWDAAGNLIRVADRGHYSVTDRSHALREMRYAYDFDDRLLAVQQIAQVTRDESGKATQPEFTNEWFAYDERDNRVLVEDARGTSAATFDSLSNRLVRSERTLASGNEVARFEYDAAGQPVRFESGAFVRDHAWDEHGRLTALTSYRTDVSDSSRTQTRYAYNHRGERVRKVVNAGNGRAAHATHYLYDDSRQLAAELNDRGQIVRQYVYLADMPVALIDTPDGVPLPSRSSAVLSAAEKIAEDLRAIAGSISGHARSALLFLHANHLGAIEAISEGTQRIVWTANYSAFGEAAEHLAADHGIEPSARIREFNLRLPGQYYDRESGLHYNSYRYYDPETGRYLTPDPLGTPDGANNYAYVRSNPLRFVDPLGLILFAFDGTGNTFGRDLLAGENESNVRKFFDRYTEAKYYVSGVGTRHRDARYGDIVPFGSDANGRSNIDMGANNTGEERIARMLTYFRGEANRLADDAALQIDIVGFSRGSAQARHFANLINRATTPQGYFRYSVTLANGLREVRCQLVNFRFMGIFDTVLSTNLGSPAYDLTISDRFGYVAHAVALNEHRGDTFRDLPGSTGAFPGESIISSVARPVAGSTRIERGFLGSHSDIGGGFSNNQLSLVPLNWMMNQAVAAGVPVGQIPTRVAASAVLHDKSDNMFDGQPRAGGEDRVMRYHRGRSVRQRAVTGMGMRYQDTQQFIRYFPRTISYRTNPRTGTRTRVGVDLQNFETGSVNMRAYVAWLKRNGYDITIDAS
jgi:RHS repeat-associated protein